MNRIETKRDELKRIEMHQNELPDLNAFHFVLGANSLEANSLGANNLGANGDQQSGCQQSGGQRGPTVANSLEANSLSSPDSVAYLFSLGANVGQQSGAQQSQLTRFSRIYFRSGSQQSGGPQISRDGFWIRQANH